MPAVIVSCSRLKNEVASAGSQVPLHKEVCQSKHLPGCPDPTLVSTIGGTEVLG